MLFFPPQYLLRSSRMGLNLTFEEFDAWLAYHLFYSLDKSSECLKAKLNIKVYLIGIAFVEFCSHIYKEFLTLLQIHIVILSKVICFSLWLLISAGVTIISLIDRLFRQFFNDQSLQNRFFGELPSRYRWLVFKSDLLSWLSRSPFSQWGIIVGCEKVLLIFS